MSHHVCDHVILLTAADCNERITHDNSVLPLVQQICDDERVQVCAVLLLHVLKHKHR